MKGLIPYLLVLLGGGLGSVSRFALTKLVFPLGYFPMATFLSNVIASFLVGVFIGLISKNPSIQSEWKLLWVIGFCGGFSTFSTFTHESLEMLTYGNFRQFIFYAGVTLLTTLCFQVLGLQSLKWIIQQTH